MLERYTHGRPRGERRRPPSPLAGLFQGRVRKDPFSVGRIRPLAGQAGKRDLASMLLGRMDSNHRLADPESGGRIRTEIREFSSKFMKGRRAAGRQRRGTGGQCP